MKTQLSIFLFVLMGLAVCAGCAARGTRPVAIPDDTHRAERQQLKGQPIPVPSVTPYDGNQQLQPVFISGFKKGWNVALEYWLGNAIIIPEEYQHSPDKAEAWRKGWTAAQHALYDRVRSRSATTSPR
jgi:hypothetical protein